MRTKYAILGMVSDTVLTVMLVASAAEASGRAVTFPSLDGTSLAGEFYEASNRPAPARAGFRAPTPPGATRRQKGRHRKPPAKRAESTMERAAG